MPILDFRAVSTQRARRPSPDLLETIYICQQRQEWYRDFARSMGEKPLSFVGSLRQLDNTVAENVVAAAAASGTPLASISRRV